MKRQILSPILMLASALILVSFVTLKKHVNDSKTTPQESVKACNCLMVDPSTITVTEYGTTDVFSWTAPAGSDPIASYTIGGYYTCGGGFGTYSYGTQMSFPNPQQCPGGTIRITTNCSNGCSSASNVYSW